MDVEGYDLAVLAGAMHQLSNHLWYAYCSLVRSCNSRPLFKNRAQKSYPVCIFAQTPIRACASSLYFLKHPPRAYATNLCFRLHIARFVQFEYGGQFFKGDGKEGPGGHNWTSFGSGVEAMDALGYMCYFTGDRYMMISTEQHD